MDLATTLLRGRIFDFVFTEAEDEEFASNGLGRPYPSRLLGEHGSLSS